MSDFVTELIELSRALGEPSRDYAILGEGNTSVRLDEQTFLVKASGFNLREISASGFVSVRFDRCLELIEREGLSDQEVKAGLQQACSNASSPLMPSVETVLHAVLLEMTGARFVGHAHPTAANQILCSRNAREAFAGRLFPDEIVCCGPAPCLVDYVDPGLPLARVVRKAVLDHQARYLEFPKVICLINHGVFATGKSGKDVLATFDMFVKVCRILQGTFANGGPQFLTTENVNRIHTRPDEHYRQSQLGLRQK